MKKFDKYLTIVLSALLLWIVVGGLYLLLDRDDTDLFITADGRINTTISIPNNIINLGVVSQGSLISSTFFIYNSGNDTLYLDHIQPDCSCTNYYMGTNVVPPHDSTSLVLFITTEGKIGPQQINTVVSANTDDRHYIVKLLFEVSGFNPQAEQDVGFVTDTIYIGHVLLGKEYLIKQYIRNNSNKDIQLVDFYTSCRCVSFTDHPTTVKPGISDPILLSIKPDASGEFSRKVTIGINKDGSIQHLSFYIDGNCIDKTNNR